MAYPTTDRFQRWQCRGKPQQWQTPCRGRPQHFRNDSEGLMTTMRKMNDQS